MPRFNLKTKQQDPALIIYIHRIRGERFVYSTGLKTSVKYWNVKRGRVKSPHLYRPGAAINNVLDRMEKAGDAFYAEGMAKGQWDWDKLREELDEITLRSSAQSERVVDFMNKILEEKKGNLKHNTYLSYKVTKRRIEKWEEDNDEKLLFKDVDLSFFYSFTGYLREEFNTSNNTLRQYMTIIKIFLIEAEQRGIQVPSDYRSKLFKIKQEQKDHTYLDEEEVQRILNAKLPESLCKIRDSFIIGCRSGQRYSDWKQVIPANVRNVDGVDVISIKQTKTGSIVAVPVHSDLRRIWERNKEIYILSNTKMNDGIRKVCRIAKIDRYEQITTHTARRTFCTLAFKAGIPTLSIAKMSGHKTEKVLLDYIRMSSTENAAQIGKHGFFRNWE